MGVAGGRGVRRAGVVALVAVVLVGLVGAVWVGIRRPGQSAAADEAHGDPGITGAPVVVGQSPCGSGWSGGTAGRLTFALWNSSSVVAEIQVQDVDSHKIYADVEDLGVRATRTLTVSLAAGHYRFLCLAADGQPVASTTWELTGDYAGPLTPGVLPTTDLDLAGPNEAYSRWIHGQLVSLRTPLARLVSATRQGKLLPARRTWATAHRGYLLLGAAYDAFGDLGDSIDGHPAVGVAALADPDLTGFGKIEAMLWHVQPAPAGRPGRAARRRVSAYLRQHVAPLAVRLSADVASVTRSFDDPVTLTNTDLGLRSHEILEDALRFDLTGQDDTGAHLTLADVDAMVVATRDVMAPLRGLLRTRDPDLATTDAWLARLQADVDGFHNRRTGAWTPLQRLTVAQRRRLNATTSQTLEYLSEIAVVLDPVQKGPQ
jgi:iron uptake system component EfeO